MLTSDTHSIHPTFLHTTQSKKWGGGFCLNIQFVSCIHPTLYSSQPLLRVRSTNTMTAVAFRKNGSFDECVLQEGACAHTNPGGIKATCIISGDSGRPSISSEQYKTWQWSENETIYTCSNFVCMCF